MDEFWFYVIKVVIDDNSLYYFLYYKNKFDFFYGGDYDRYVLKIREFFSFFYICNI